MNSYETLLKSASFYKGQISHSITLPQREAVYETPKHTPSNALMNKLEELNIQQFYSHQAKALDLAAEGKNFALVTGTASGKTMAYNLPVLDAISDDFKSRAIYLYPTKALAQDQSGKIDELNPSSWIKHAAYDGDTPKNARSGIRTNAHIILTNPDMLHIGILPNHELWNRFFNGLRFVVIDEMHSYRGILGAHVGNILRRLLRLAKFYGAAPQIICCSATISNPKELAETLTGEEFEVINEDGSPKGERTIILWNPPELVAGERKSPNVETTQLLTFFANEGIKHIVFARARVTAELMLRYTLQGFSTAGIDLSSKIDSYRGGYTPEERRGIEKRLFHGDLLGVVATNALELGVDIGGLDAVVMNGYPGTISSFWQQAGRAGRVQQSSLSIMIANNDPLEQYLLRHPETLLDQMHEAVKTKPDNPYILASHLRCAAFELPLSVSELEQFGSHAMKLCEAMENQGLMQYSDGKWFLPITKSPASEVNIRTASDDIYTVTDIRSGRIIGYVEGARAFETIHEGAIYLHRGESFRVLKLDLVNKRAEAELSKFEYYTEAIVENLIEINEKIYENELGAGDYALGFVTVTTNVLGYRKKALFSEQMIGVETLNLPSRSFQTMSAWFLLPQLMDNKTNKPIDYCSPMTEEQGDKIIEMQAAAHTIEHVAGSMVPILVSCDRRDIGTVWYSMHPNTQRTTVFIYDTIPGGVGLVEEAYSKVHEWLAAIKEVIGVCSCLTGCPGCIMSTRCPQKNERISKMSALNVIDQLLQTDKRKSP